MPHTLRAGLPVNTTSTVMSVQFTDLQEFSIYRATVTAMFNATFEVTPASSNLNFTTLSAGMHELCPAYIHSFFLSSAPTGAPRDPSYTVTSTSVNLNWLQMECIDRNGVITNYTVVFLEQGGVVIPGEVIVMNRNLHC